MASARTCTRLRRTMPHTWRAPAFLRLSSVGGKKKKTKGGAVGKRNRAAYYAAYNYYNYRRPPAICSLIAMLHSTDSSTHLLVRRATIVRIFAVAKSHEEEGKRERHVAGNCRAVIQCRDRFLWCEMKNFRRRKMPGERSRGETQSDTCGFVESIVIEDTCA